MTFTTQIRGRRAARTGPVLAGLAVLIGLWLGLTAPSVSPVSPPPAGTQTTTSVDSIDGVPPVDGSARR